MDKSVNSLLINLTRGVISAFDIKFLQMETSSTSHLNMIRPIIKNEFASMN